MNCYGLQSLYVIIKEKDLVLERLNNSRNLSMDDFINLIESLKNNKQLILFKEFETTTNTQDLKENNFNILFEIDFN